MFTGIVSGASQIVAVQDHSAGRRLTVDLASCIASDPLVVGESVAIDGVCLTVSSADQALAKFDVIAETLRRTTLGRRRAGDSVNVERALRPSDRLGGHFVQGHVDGVATLAERRDSPREIMLCFAGDAELLGSMIPKGSVAIDGVSLTLVEVDRRTGRFSVALIPTTLEMTTLARRQVGEPANIETDLIGKWVRCYLADLLGVGGRDGQPGQPNGARPDGLTLEKLRDAGFV